METTRGTLGLLRHLDASLASRPEDELIAQVLGGAEPPAALLATAARLARLPFWERRALGASGLVRDHRVPPREAIRLAAEVGDGATKELLDHILVDEDEHVDWLEEQLDQVQQMGLPVYLSTQTRE